jgi:hypothetical protein
MSKKKVKTGVGRRYNAGRVHIQRARELAEAIKGRSLIRKLPNLIEELISLREKLEEK